MSTRTKIVATIGPASAKADVLRRIVQAGCDVCRVNFSHGDDAQHEQILRTIRQVEQESGMPVAVMADLCGPKIRVGRIAGGSALMGEGQTVTIQRELVEGGADRFSTTLDELVGCLAVGEAILLDDGKIRLEVVRVSPPDEAVCKVTRSGILSSGKGINLPGTRLKLSALTEKDRRDAEWIASRDFDYVALSFVRSADDVRELRELLTSRGCDAHIVAKIEKPQAVEHIEEILAVVDAVMVARGDLGVEMDLPHVPAIQKHIAHLAQQACKPCIVATQMLETMTERPVPTRAEVSDVANAVLDLTDAVMLSGETAVGQYPVQAVEMMNEIATAMQEYREAVEPPAPAPEDLPRTMSAIAAAVQRILEVEKIAAVAVFTLTGGTARVLAKSRLACPILGISPSRRAVRRMNLYFGVEPFESQAPPHTRDLLKLAERFAIERGLAGEGERIVVVSGRPLGQPGATNNIAIHQIGQTRDEED